MSFLQKIGAKIAAFFGASASAFIAAHKAQVSDAIDAEAARLKAQKVSSAAQVRDRLAAVAQQKAQSLGVPAYLVPLLTAQIDALVLPGVYANTDATVDALAAKAKAVVEGL